jgi:hypothetical protein
MLLFKANCQPFHYQSVLPRAAVSDTLLSPEDAPTLSDRRNDCITVYPGRASSSLGRVC